MEELTQVLPAYLGTSWAGVKAVKSGDLAVRVNLPHLEVPVPAPSRSAAAGIAQP